jgi:lysophospholipase L1-like esterase
MRIFTLLCATPYFFIACSSNSRSPKDDLGIQGGSSSVAIGGKASTSTGGHSISTAGGALGLGGASAAIGGAGVSETITSVGGRAFNSSNPGGSTSAGASTACTPLDLGVHIVGRRDDCLPATEVKLSWSGSGFVGAFTGSGISIHLREFGAGNQYSVLIDGKLSEKLIAKTGAGTYPLASSLPIGPHTVEFYRRTEASFSPAALSEIVVADGNLTPPKVPERYIEVVGDSISCGYGDEGEIATCPFSADTENHYLTYGSLLARQFHAEVSTIAWSGRGVVSNYNGDKSSLTMPRLYGRSLANTATSPWDFRTKAQVVIINLGTNDYSTDHDPTDAEFVSTYADLLATIRSHYADAYILCTIGPMLSGQDLIKARANIAAAVTNRVSAGDTHVEAYELAAENPNPGCDYHPNLATHQAIADELARKLSAVLGW